MEVAYTIKDNLGNSGKTVPLTQGESRLISVFLFNPDGSPFIIPGTISTIVVKIFSQISQASIQKTLAASQVAATMLAGNVIEGMFGFEFTMAPADTSLMAANNSGLPMLATITDSTGNVTELNFVSVFNVTPKIVLT